MDALIMLPYWGEKILKNNKTFEIRSSGTKKVGERVALAYSRTGKLYGSVEIVDSMPLTKELWENNKDKHQIYGLSYEELIERYPHPYIWELKDPVLFSEPLDYVHPKGAVIWVKDALGDLIF